MQEKKIHSVIKSKLHPRNKHNTRYDFNVLKNGNPDLIAFVKINDYGDESIDFFEPKAVKALNKALIQHYYNIKAWDIPEEYLCPPVPGRADYIHYAADLFKTKEDKSIPKGAFFRCLDIGIGANGIYPIIGLNEYGWSFVGSEVDDQAIASIEKIRDNNQLLASHLEVRKQLNKKVIFGGILKKNEKFDLVICNPPFHSSAEDARLSNVKKLSNLKGSYVTKPNRNFSGKNNELWCEGGELAFIQQMILESKEYKDNCFWFTTLVSKQSHELAIIKSLKKLHPFNIKIIPMGQGNKVSRMIAWTFLSNEKQKNWKASNWK